MKDLTDNSTAELFPLPKKRGRPPKPQAKTGAERQRAYLANKKKNPVFTLGSLAPDEQRQVDKFLKDYRQRPSMSVTGLYCLIRAEMEVSGCSDASLVDLETLWRYAVAGS